MTASNDLKVDWANVQTRAITAGGVDFAYRELGEKNPGVPVVFLIHLAAVLDNWDPRVVNGFAAKRRVIAFDNRGVGATSGAAQSAAIVMKSLPRCRMVPERYYSYLSRYSLRPRAR